MANQTRRTFLKSSLMAGGSATCLRGAYLPGSLHQKKSINSRVVTAHDPEIRDQSGKPISARVHNLMDLAIQAYFDADTPSHAWSSLVNPNQTVGIKVNCLAGLGMSTSVDIVDNVCERLQEAGIRKNQIIVWDRLSRDLERAAFKIRESQNSIRCYGNDHLGFEPELQVYGSVGSLLSRTFVRECDVVLNITLLKDHGITGFTGALKNLFGAIHNPNKYHLNNGDPYIADVWMLPSVRKKVRINICEAIEAQYHGGPSFMPQWTWPYNRILVSSDPVAMDWIGWKAIEEKRKENDLPSLKDEEREPAYILTAADEEHNLGTTNEDRILREEIQA